jgi:hypothetical protein
LQQFVLFEYKCVGPIVHLFLIPAVEHAIDGLNARMVVESEGNRRIPLSENVLEGFSVLKSSRCGHASVFVMSCFLRHARRSVIEAGRLLLQPFLKDRQPLHIHRLQAAWSRRGCASELVRLVPSLASYL